MADPGRSEVQDHSLDTVKQRVQAAQSAARETQRAVAQLSTARLAELRAMPAKAAARHLDDHSLSAADRAHLQHWLRQKLPRHQPKPRRRLSGLLQAVRWLLRFPRLLLLTLGLLVCAGLAWHNTPATIGSGQTTRALDIAWPGRSTPHTLPAGTKLGVVGYTATEWQVPVWRPGMGYAVIALGGNDISVQLTAEE